MAKKKPKKSQTPSYRGKKVKKAKRKSPEVLLNPSVDDVDLPRLSRQCQRILRRLLDRNLPNPSNKELSQIALKYTGRLSEIREALKQVGWNVVVVERRKNGLNFYGIVESEVNND